MKVLNFECGENQLGLTEDEQKVMITCIYMAAREGFYGFNWENIENGREICDSILQKLGLTPEDAECIMEGI